MGQMRADDCSLLLFVFFFSFRMLTSDLRSKVKSLVSKLSTFSTVRCLSGDNMWSVVLSSHFLFSLSELVSHLQRSMPAVASICLAVVVT